MESQSLLKAGEAEKRESKEPFYSVVSGILAVICVILMGTLVCYHVSMTSKVRIFALTKDLKVARADFVGEISGYLRLSVVGEYLSIEGELANLRPGAQHGVHVLAMVPEDGVDRNDLHFGAGGLHGCPGVSLMHHAGDLGNLSGDETGKAEVKLLTKAIGLAEVLGRTIAITEERDPCEGQVEGRIIARGVIAAAQKTKEFLAS